MAQLRTPLGEGNNKIGPEMGESTASALEIYIGMVKKGKDQVDILTNWMLESRDCNNTKKRENWIWRMR